MLFLVFHGVGLGWWGCLDGLAALINHRFNVRYADAVRGFVAFVQDALRSSLCESIRANHGPLELFVRIVARHEVAACDGVV